MPEAGMVHALEMIHHLIGAQGGSLIDIHPRAVPRPLMVRIDQRRYEIERLVDEVRFATYRQADKALTAVVKAGLYRLDTVDPFVFQVYFDSADELAEYLLTNDARTNPTLKPAMDPDLIERVEAHLKLPGHHKSIVLQRPVTIRKYRPVL